MKLADRYRTMIEMVDDDHISIARIIDNRTYEIVLRVSSVKGLFIFAKAYEHVDNDEFKREAKLKEECDA